MFMSDVLLNLLFLFLKIAIGLLLSYVLLIVLLLIAVKTDNKKRLDEILTKPKKLPLFLDFFRWCVVDILRGKQYPVWGIYMFVAKPGNGKTISMTEHIERVRKEHPDIKVYSNFNIKGQDGKITCWKDIVEAPDNCIIAIDEIHMIFGSINYADFPIEMLGEITQNRHSRKQFITSTQDYDLVNLNFKRVCNFVVLCKNFWGLDRLFINYYFDRGIYESKNFQCDKRKAEFMRMFVASDDTYSRYDTLEKIQGMVNEIEHKDINGVIKTLKDLKSCGDLQQKEVKYISNIIDRINLDIQSKELWESKNKEIQSLKEELEQLKLLNVS
ncbi:hypothetical protein [Clostridium saccharoperbutylacetonicum]|nr:hypothetical protein [Clostridium saccharoperbutylacetonicum]AQR93358.1 zonular occludens toxin (Zot) [Clostridium saccharoperbutylacetonicum]AQR93367.1 zonular occludens toxin (Zot) [Clostridium saccharoperbutylacetonicum]NSB29064.1 hypothetical protein [Clostridium saccharoperbutylacetonicum]